MMGARRFLLREADNVLGHTTLEVVCLDDRLVAAARREGFRTLGLG